MTGSESAEPEHCEQPRRRICIGDLVVRDRSENQLALGTMGFEDFLDTLSRIRAWLQQSMTEELRPLFDRCLRRRGTSGMSSESAVLGIPEVCMALEDLGMAPTCGREQQEVSRLLEDANEW